MTDLIEKNIISGGYNDIPVKYHILKKYNRITGGIKEFRYRLGGMTQFNIMNGIIGLGLIDEQYFDESVDGGDNYSPYISGGKFKKNIKKKQDVLTDKDIRICKEIGDLFDIDFDILRSEEFSLDEVSFVLKILKKIYTKPSSEFVVDVVEKFGLKQIICDSLQRIHEALSTQYSIITHMYAQNFPKKVKIMSFSNFPLNYSENLIKFKNIVYKDKDLAECLDKVKGFCPYESMIRVQQLLNFPIDILTNELSGEKLDMPHIEEFNLIEFKTELSKELKNIEEDIKKPTTEKHIELIRWYAEKIIERQQFLQKYIEKYELYYIKITETLDAFSNYLESNMP